MPYKCVNCSKMYEDGSGEVLTGCSDCKGKFFFYIRKEQIAKMQENAEQSDGQTEIELGAAEKRQMEKDVREIAGIKDDETPVFLEFESVKIIKPGKYLVDVSKLFDKNKPRVYKLEDGKYIVDLAMKNRGGK